MVSNITDRTFIEREKNYGEALKLLSAQRTYIRISKTYQNEKILIDDVRSNRIYDSVRRNNKCNRKCRPGNQTNNQFRKRSAAHHHLLRQGEQPVQSVFRDRPVKAIAQQIEEDEQVENRIGQELQGQMLHDVRQSERGVGPGRRPLQQIQALRRL